MGAAAKQTEFYLVINDEKFGPVTREDVFLYLSSGKISLNDLIWAEGYSDWVEIQSVREFSALSNKPKRASSRQLPQTESTTRRNVKLVVLAVLMLLNAVWIVPFVKAFTGAVEKPHEAPASQAASPPAPRLGIDSVVDGILASDFGRLGKFSVLLEKISGPNGAVSWAVGDGKYVAKIKKANSEHSITFLKRKDSDEKATNVELSTITVNGSECPREFFSETALCIGLIAKAQ